MSSLTSSPNLYVSGCSGRRGRGLIGGGGGRKTFILQKEKGGSGGRDVLFEIWSQVGCFGFFREAGHV